MNKQHLLMVDDLVMSLLKQLVPGMMFVPVVGMDINDQPAFKLLAVPFEQTMAAAVVPEPCVVEPTE